MSNDISDKLNKYIGSNMGHAQIKNVPAKNVKFEENNHSTKDYETTQDYFNALGRTKVNMDKTSLDNRIMSSIQTFKANPDYVQQHIDFCEDLVKNGYNLEEAIIGTDIIFDKLKNETTYHH